MRRFSVQVPEDLWVGLNDLARRERQPLQHLLRDVLQAVVDGDGPGRVASAGTREAIDAIDALREEQSRDAGRWAAVMEAIEALGKEQQRGGAERAELLMGNIYALRDKLDRFREEDEGGWEELKAAVRELKGGPDQLQSEGDRVPELETPPAPDEARRGLRGRIFGGGGGK